MREKARVYAPIKRKEGIEWKELHAGIARMMQYFCSEYKTEKLLNMGLDALNEIEKDFVPNLYALDPHKLLRSLEDLSILTFLSTDHPRLSGAQGKQPEFEFPEDRLSANGSARMEEVHHS